MPLLPAPDLRPPYFLVNSDLETIVPSLFRKVEGPAFMRERISTPDNDFLDLDKTITGSPNLVVLSHGLEGDSGRPYIKGMAKAFAEAGFDVVAWNYRGCSGETNRMLRSYHSGATEDLEVVLQHILSDSEYESISLIGFSLGGNLTLKYLGERGADLDSRISCAVGISVPCDLEKSAEKLGRMRNMMYQKRFISSLRAKLRAKQAVLPNEERLQNLPKLANFFAFDDYYTAPVHGYANAREYYRACSALGFLHNIRIPALILNAENDPFLTPECYPVEQARQSAYVFLEMPARGGHVGFCTDFGNNQYYSEQRAVAFVSEYASLNLKERDNKTTRVY